MLAVLSLLGRLTNAGTPLLVIMPEHLFQEEILISELSFLKENKIGTCS